MLPRVAAGCFAALLMVWPARCGLDTGTLDAFSPEAVLAPGDNQVAQALQTAPEAGLETRIPAAAQDAAPAPMAALDPAQPAIAPPPATEPFGLPVAPVAGGDVVAKWSGVE